MGTIAIDDRIPTHVFRFVERELYDYPVNKELVMDYLQRRNDELTRGRQAPESLTIHGKYQVADTGTLSGEVSNPVQSKAIRLLALEHKAERALFYVQAIDSVLSTLTTVDKQLIKLKYFEGKLTNAGVASELGIGERQFYEWRNTIIRKFALRLGMA